MSKVKNPQEKKRLRLDEDHVVVGGEAAHAFRKAWPKKKAAANRRYRRKADHLVKVAEKDLEVPSLVDEDSAAITREMVRVSVPQATLVKWGVMTAREEIERSLAARKHRHGAKKLRQAKRQSEPKG